MTRKKMKKDKIKLLILIFIITMQITVIAWLFLMPKYTYISYNQFDNIVNHRYYTDTGSIIPNMNIYKNEKIYNLHEIIKSQKYSYIIIDNCPCKREFINKYIDRSSSMQIPIIYIYLNKKEFEKDKYEEKNKLVSKYMCSMQAILLFLIKMMLIILLLYII